MRVFKEPGTKAVLRRGPRIVLRTTIFPKEKAMKNANVKIGGGAQFR